MVTIKDIAREAGVSYATVSRALNNKKDVSEKTRILIHELAEEMGYRPNVIARSLVMKRSTMIGLVLPDVSNPFFADIARSVSLEATKHGYSTLIINSGWDTTNEIEQMRLLLDQRVAGIIIKPTGYYAPGTFEKTGVPIVSFWHPSDDRATYLEVDHKKGTQLAVQNLIDRGFKRIAFLGGTDTSPANQLRLLSFQKTLQTNNLQIHEHLVSFGGFNVESGYERIKALMTGKNPPEGIFCGNDYIALGVLEYLREIGANLPDEIGLIGYDDIFFSQLPIIKMSSIRQPRDVMGKLAVEQLVDQLTDDVVLDEPKKILVEPELILRLT
jgi:LacI family transcriptional regulator